MDDLALELFHTRDLGDVDLGSEAEAEDDVLSCGGRGFVLAWACLDGPLLCVVIPVCATDTVVEAAVLAKLELLIEMVEVLAKLLVVWVLAGEVPRSPYFWE